MTRNEKSEQLVSDKPAENYSDMSLHKIRADAKKNNLQTLPFLRAINTQIYRQS